MKISIPLLLGLLLFTIGVSAQTTNAPVRFGLVGLHHDHAAGFLPRLEGRTDVQLVGIVETNTDLIARYSRRFHLDRSLFYPTLDALYAAQHPQAVATFTSTYEHEGVVEFCADHHLDVMMEKPLATNMKQARAIESAVNRSGIQLIVNYETSWYPGNQQAYTLVHDQHQIGDIRRIVVHDGH